MTDLFSFSSSMAFFRHTGLEVLYTDNYTGDPTSTSWDTVNVNLASESDGDHNWVSSGDVDLAPLGSSIHIAFKYTGTSSANTTTFRLDDITIR